MNPNDEFKENEILNIKKGTFVIRHIGKVNNIMILEEVTDSKLCKIVVTPSVLHVLFFIAISLAINVNDVWAATSVTGLQFETILQTVSKSLSGPIANSMAVIAFAVAGISLMLFEVNKGLRWIVSILIAYSFASGGATVLTKFGMTTALL